MKMLGRRFFQCVIFCDSKYILTFTTNQLNFALTKKVFQKSVPTTTIFPSQTSSKYITHYNRNEQYRVV